MIRLNNILNNFHEEYAKVEEMAGLYSIQYAGKCAIDLRRNHSYPDIRIPKEYTRTSAIRDFCNLKSDDLILELSKEFKNEQITLDMAICGLDQCKLKNRGIKIFVNNRLIQSMSIKSLILNQIKHFNPKINKLFAYVSIRFHNSNQMIDVNIHPTKHEVIFLNDEKINSSIIMTVDEMLSIFNSQRTFDCSLSQSKPISSIQSVQLTQSQLLFKNTNNQPNSSQVLSLNDTIKSNDDNPSKKVRIDPSQTKLSYFYHSQVLASTILPSTATSLKLTPTSSSLSSPSTATSSETTKSNIQVYKNNSSNQTSCTDKSNNSPLTLKSLLSIRNQLLQDVDLQLKTIFSNCVYIGLLNPVVHNPKNDDSNNYDDQTDKNNNNNDNNNKSYINNDHHHHQKNKNPHSSLRSGSTSMNDSQQFTKDIYSMIQYEQDLIVVNISLISTHLIYQIFIFNMGSFNMISLKPPISIEWLLKLIIEEQPNANKLDEIKDYIISKSDILMDYFSMEISADGYILKLPEVISGLEPNLSRLPSFLLQLFSEIDWNNEVKCLSGISMLFSHLYRLDHSNPIKLEFNSIIENAFIPYIKQYFIPTNQLFMNGSQFQKITNISSLYKCFDRC